MKESRTTNTLIQDTDPLVNLFTLKTPAAGPKPETLSAHALERNSGSVGRLTSEGPSASVRTCALTTSNNPISHHASNLVSPEITLADLFAFHEMADLGIGRICKFTTNSNGLTTLMLRFF